MHALKIIHFMRSIRVTVFVVRFDETDMFRLDFIQRKRNTGVI